MPLSKGLDQLVVRSAMLSKKEFFNCESFRRAFRLIVIRLIQFT